MSSATTSKVSFTIRRPTPVSRDESSGGDSDSGFKVPHLPRHLVSGGSTPGSPLARSAPASPKHNSRKYTERDSSDEDEEIEDELVTGFDSFGVQRLHEKRKEPQGPLVIPALKNKDWRELARKRKALYVPPSAQAETGADGSVGGFGTRDAINSGAQLSGLQMKKRVKLEDEAMAVEEAHETQVVAKVENEVKEEETEDQKAIRLLLARARSDDATGLDGPAIEAIPPPSEDDAYRQDVVELPESASLEDYERIPVSQFGAALLRGMGWKEGTSASKKNKGLIEPWLPQARPALLGIGAKEREVFDDGSKGKKGRKGKPDKKYIPVVKRERQPGEGSGSGTGSGTSSRRRSPSPIRTSSRRASRSPSPERRRDRDRRDADYDRDKGRDSKDREPDLNRDRGGNRDRDRYLDKGERDRDRDMDRRRDDRRWEGDRRAESSGDRYDSDGRRRDKDRRGY
ncbi:Pre-mRNA-splicing factor spp2 [Sparassis crispa]|uniref:Pre-mRNA-splicing factor spp2 n=1 Tax=Sparassis crispa TaxID=139825 RepID=A0A401GNU2_9APHY|nr:Pre-mRNA-splicing factor spp2 [Sparassis crispa]GBE83840.1 Pre-mRNA-splicing factor spp2 [Sparassis crispa]